MEENRKYMFRDSKTNLSERRRVESYHWKGSIEIYDHD